MPVESSSVQEYLDQMHEYTTIAAIQARMFPKAVPAFLDEILLLKQRALEDVQSRVSQYIMQHI